MNRAISAALVASVVSIACGAGESGTLLTGPAETYQQPAGNDQQPSNTGQRPSLWSSWRPIPTNQQPSPNPDQPVAFKCSEFCGGIHSACAEECANFCMYVPEYYQWCASEIAAALGCVSQIGFACDPENGDLHVPNDQCEDEGRALLDCLEEQFPEIYDGSGGSSNSGSSGGTVEPGAGGQRQ